MGSSESNGEGVGDGGVGEGRVTKFTFSKIDSVIDCWSENVPEDWTWFSALLRASMSPWRLDAEKALRQVGVGVTPVGHVAAE